MRAARGGRRGAPSAGPGPSRRPVVGWPRPAGVPGVAGSARVVSLVARPCPRPSAPPLAPAPFRRGPPALSLVGRAALLPPPRPTRAPPPRLGPSPGPTPRAGVAPGPSRGAGGVPGRGALGPPRARRRAGTPRAVGGTVRVGRRAAASSSSSSLSPRGNRARPPRWRRDPREVRGLLGCRGTALGLGGLRRWDPACVPRGGRFLSRRLSFPPRRAPRGRAAAAAAAAFSRRLPFPSAGPPLVPPPPSGGRRPRGPRAGGRRRPPPPAPVSGPAAAPSGGAVGRGAAAPPTRSFPPRPVARAPGGGRVPAGRRDRRGRPASGLGASRASCPWRPFPRERGPASTRPPGAPRPAPAPPSGPRSRGRGASPALRAARRVCAPRRAGPAGGAVPPPPPPHARPAPRP